MGLYNQLNDLILILNQNRWLLIFEPNTFHHECLPGFSKYLIDLGFNVDILIHSSGINSFILFNESDKICLFTFNNISQIIKEGKKLSIIIKQYDFIILQTNNNFARLIYNKLDLLSINNSILIIHDTESLDEKYSKYIKQNRIWTLGNISKYIQVNPHYFGNTMKIKDKNKETKFFFTSTNSRNYKYLIDSLNKLKNENYNFKIVITGKSRKLNSFKISKNLYKNIKFKYEASYFNLFKAVENCDYIIIPLDSESQYERKYNKSMVTGSMQLSYGFIKPVIINQEFAGFYNLNINNSLLYNNFNLYEILKEAILLSNDKYKMLQKNIYLLEKKVYQASLNNIKKTFTKV